MSREIMYQFRAGHYPKRVEEALVFDPCQNEPDLRVEIVRVVDESREMEQSARDFMFRDGLNDYRLKGGRLLARLKVAAAFRAAVVHRRRTAPR